MGPACAAPSFGQDGESRPHFLSHQPNDAVSFLPARHIKETGRDLPAIRFPVLAFRLNPIRGKLPS